jgi:hypothetical protein
MGCIYHGVCFSLVALFLWQQVTKLSAVMAQITAEPKFVVDLCNLRETYVSNMVIRLAGG